MMKFDADVVSKGPSGGNIGAVGVNRHRFPVLYSVICEKVGENGTLDLLSKVKLEWDSLLKWIKKYGSDASELQLEQLNFEFQRLKRFTEVKKKS